MADHSEARRKAEEPRRGQRRRPFYESSLWTWPQFDPESCQQCGHVIPMSETGWILARFILCESCYLILNEESQRRGSVTIAPGVVLHRDDSTAAMAEVVPPAPPVPPTPPVPPQVTQTRAVIQVPAAAARPPVIISLQVVATAHVLEDAAEDQSTVTPPTEETPTIEETGPTQEATVEAAASQEAERPVEPEAMTNHAIKVYDELIASQPEPLLHVDNLVEPEWIEEEPTGETVELEGRSEEVEAVEAVEAVADYQEETREQTKEEAVAEAASVGLEVPVTEAPEETESPAQVQEASEPSIPCEDMTATETEEVFTAAPCVADALPALDDEPPAVEERDEVSQVTEEIEEIEEIEANEANVPIEYLQPFEAIEPAHAAADPITTDETVVAEPAVEDDAPIAQEPESVAVTPPAEVEPAPVAMAHDSTSSESVPLDEETPAEPPAVADQSPEVELVEALAIVDVASEAQASEPTITDDADALIDITLHESVVDEPTAAIEPLIAAAPDESVPVIESPIAQDARVEADDTIDSAPEIPADAVSESPELVEREPDLIASPITDAEPAPQAIADPVAEPVLEAEPAPAESIVADSPALPTLDEPPPVSAVETAPPPAAPATPPAPVPPEAPEPRRRKARRRRHPVDAWLDALSSKEPQDIVHRAMTRAAYPPSFDAEENARLLSLAVYLRNRWMENVEPHRAMRSA